MTKLTTTYVRLSGQMKDNTFGVKKYAFHQTPESFKEVTQNAYVKQDFLAVTNAVLVTRVTEETEQPLL